MIQNETIVETQFQLTDEERSALIMKEIAASIVNSEITDRSFYSICPVDRISKLARNSNRESNEYNILMALHCVNYSAMTPAVRRNLTELVQIVLKPVVGELRVSDKTHMGIRLFETSYLPESYVTAEAQSASTGIIDRFLARIGFGTR